MHKSNGLLVFAVRPNRNITKQNTLRISVVVTVKEIGYYTTLVASSGDIFVGVPNYLEMCFVE